MNRKEFELALKTKYNGSDEIPENEKENYLRRLKKTYYKKGCCKSFYDQFNAGSGSELKEKFWSTHSSSRFAFEMYSWMANDNRINDIEFELKLVACSNASRGVPNMDVFIELPDKLVFIESKLTEKYKQTIECNKNSLPGAYWKEKGDPMALTTSKQPLGTTLIHRYMDDEVALKAFLDFINYFHNKLERNELAPACWMEYGQEIKHLFGIYFYLKKHIEYHGKKVEFYNIYYNLEDEIGDIILEFFAKGEEMMNILLKPYGIDFSYTFKTAQDVIALIPDNIKAYGTNENLKEVLNKRFLV